MATIPVVVSAETDSVLESGTLSPRGGVSARIADLDADALRESITGLTGQIAHLFDNIKAVGDYQLKEVTVQLEVNAKGGVSLIGSLEAGARGAITLKFSP